MSDCYRIGLLQVAETGTPSPNRRVRALPAEARPHEWFADGAHQRCHGCGMLDSWAGAKYACSPAQFSGEERERAMAERKRASMAKRRAEARARR